MIAVQLRPVVLGAVQNALAQNPNPSLNDQSLANKIIIEITPFVTAGVQQQIDAQLEAKRQEQARIEAQRR